MQAYQKLKEYEITEYKGKTGYWVKLHQFLKLSSYNRHFLTDKMRDNKEIRKTFYKKNEEKVLMFFVIIDKPLYTPDEAKLFYYSKLALNDNVQQVVEDDEDDEDNTLQIVEYNGKKGYWLKTRELGELINRVNVTQMYSKLKEDEYPEEIELDIISQRKWRYFVCIDREPYTREEALSFRNELLIKNLESEKVSHDEMIKFKELKRLSALLKETPDLIERLEVLQSIEPQELDQIVEMGNKFKNLFE